ncbi:MAG: AsnC family transcriptional regulator [Enterovirga sp.]|jgi:Lrp/AsnC family leucine-responsive transcriptional regulator|nr:AsnC family transcriptional regulator [Enterovirga sp.]
MDRIGAALLTELVRDGRASHVSLSERIGLSPTACARRQRSLEEDGFITGYQAVLDLKKLGFSMTVMVRVSLDSQSEEALVEFEQAVASCPSVLRCFLMSGSDDYVLIAAVQDIEDFEFVHKTQLSRLPRVMRLHSSFAIREVINNPLPRFAPGGSNRGGQRR